MLGARTGAWAKAGGGVPAAKDYVQDGLIAMWDGIENAGYGVHDASATVWKDVSGNGHDIDMTSNSGSGSCSWGTNFLDVNGDVIILNNPIHMADKPNFPRSPIIDNHTFECVMSVEKMATSGTMRVGTVGICFDSYDGKLYPWVMNVARSYYWDITCVRKFTKISLNTIYSFSVQQGNPDYTFSKNGYFESLSEGGYTLASKNPYDFSLFGGYGSANGKWKILCARLYGKTLTAEEVAANYVIDAARFGIGLGA